MSLDPAITEALDEVLAKQPQRPELKTQFKQLVANWFDRNASEDDVARLVRIISVPPEKDE